MAATLLLCLAAAGCRRGVPLLSYTVTGSCLHDSTLFTEGLFFHEGLLFESSGAPTNLPSAKSVIGYTELSSGIFHVKTELDKNRHFGEGIALLHNRIYQLTYANRLGFIYDAATFTPLDSFHYASEEGWGLTTDGRRLIMSDGTDRLSFLEPGSLAVDKTLPVTENGAPRDSLNELEYIKGFIYANIWLSNTIVKIDPNTGAVVGKIDLTALTNEVRYRYMDADVLNGIAYDAGSNTMFVTGKLWPLVYTLSVRD